jgi:hypothetical protein
MRFVKHALLALVALPLLGVAVFIWSINRPQPPLVNCDHVPYLRAQIGDKLLTIPRKYARRAIPFDDTQYASPQAGDLYGRCQTDSDPPVPIETIMLSEEPNVGYELDNLGGILPRTRIFITDVGDATPPPNGFERYQNGRISSYGLRWGQRTSLGVQIEGEIQSQQDMKEFEKKIKIFMWALEQPPENAPITADGDFDLQRLIEKEKSL